MSTEQLVLDVAATRIGLAPSKVHGIGVFALVDIPAETSDLFSPAGETWPSVPLADVEKLPAHARRLIDTYCLQDETHAYLPPRGFKVIDLVIYLNHSDTPNMRQVDGGDYFTTLRDVATGEELLIDYGQLDVS